MAVAQKHMSLEEFLELPEEKPALEFEDGMVSQKVSPKPNHSRIQSVFDRRFFQTAETRKLAMAFPELRTTFGGRSYVPDVAVFLWDRLPIKTDRSFISDVHEPPDIVIEIVSPKQSVTALLGKCVWYTENGVKIAVLVDPEELSVFLFRPDQAPVRLDSDERIALDDVLPEFDLTVRELFDSLHAP